MTIHTRLERPARIGAWLQSLAAGFLPGLLAGTQLTGLLYFLNPELPVTPWTLLRGLVRYGVPLGTGSALVLGLLVARQPRRAWRLLPWTLTAVLATAALFFAYHASHFAFYLPPGMNKRLIKAASWLSVGALIAFYTALLHSMERRRYGRRSVWGLVALAFVSVALLVERREAFKPRPDPGPLQATVELGSHPYLWVIGLEGATLDALLPLAEQGRLPTFARLLETGSYGRLRTLKPHNRAALWTVAATGQLPYRHGILDEHSHRAGFLAPGSVLQLVPRGIGFPIWGVAAHSRLATDTSALRSPSLWEILEKLGIATGFVGWPISHPVSDTVSFGFSELFFRGRFDVRFAQPPELAERGELFQLADAAIEAELAESIGPSPPATLARALASDRWRESLALFLADEKPDAGALFIYLPGLGEVSRAYFGGFSAVEFDGSQDSARQYAAEMLTAYYQHLDDFLARVLERDRAPDLLAIVSTHGTAPYDGARRLWNELTASGLSGHFGGAPDGILLLSGSGVRPGEFVTDAHLVDVLPTLAYGLGLPVARDVEGRVLTEVFESGFLARHPVIFVPSYDAVAAERQPPISSLP